MRKPWPPGRTDGGQASRLTDEVVMVVDLRARPPAVWVPETRGALILMLLILVKEPAEAIASFDLVDLGWGAAEERSCRSSLTQGADARG